MLNAAKSSLTSCCVGFVRDRGAGRLLRGVSLQPPHFKSLATLPNPPPLRLGKFFVIPILWLVSDQERMIILSWCDLMYIICLFMQLRILSDGAERHICSLPYLIMLKSSVFFFHPIFVRKQSLIPYLFQSTQRWALLYILQASKMQLWACINITLTMASIIRISQEKENKDVKGAFSKITTQVQTKPFNNLLQNTINKLKLHPRTTQAQNLLPLIPHTLNRLKINKKVFPHPTHFQPVSSLHYRPIRRITREISV